MTDYNAIAEKFLTDNCLDLHIEYVGKDYYFDTDRQKRDVYRWVLTNRLKFPTVSTSGRFGQSIANTGKRKPRAYDILACLTKYDPGTFSNFCAEYGYSTDSISAREVYFELQKEFDGLIKVIPAIAWNDFCEIN